jgi:hypothetical protein
MDILQFYNKLYSKTYYGFICIFVQTICCCQVSVFQLQYQMVVSPVV